MVDSEKLLNMIALRKSGDHYTNKLVKFRKFIEPDKGPFMSTDLRKNGMDRRTNDPRTIFLPNNLSFFKQLNKKNNTILQIKHYLLLANK